MAFVQLPLVALDLALLALVPAFTFLTILIFRNPLGPKWLGTVLAEEIGVLAMIVADVVVFCFAVEGLFQANIELVPGAVLIAATLAVATVATWFLFGIGRRLAEADAGRSPFSLGGGAPSAGASA